MMRVPLVTIALAVASLALATLIGARLFNGTQAQALLATPPRPRADVPLRLDAPDSTANLGSIQASAVFHASRSFYVAPPPSVTTLPPPDYRVTGSMALPNRPLTAMLLHNQTRASARVAVGDQLEGWTVVEVQPRRVVLQHDGTIAELGSSATMPSNGMSLVRGATNAAASGTPATGTSGMMRVISGEGRSNAPRPPASPPRAPSDDASRLYRPPTG